MRLRFEQLLSKAPDNELAPAYLLTGDEPLQLMQAGDHLRAWSRNLGIDERIVMDVDSAFDWYSLGQQAASPSLFAERRLVELRLRNSKLGKEGANALLEYFQGPPPEDILVVSMGKLDKRAQSAKWFKAFDQAGVVVQIWPISSAELPGWLVRQGAKLGLKLNADAAQLIAGQVEGNLLAASQELEKLALASDSNQIAVDDILSGVGDSARYDIFGLTDRALAGETAQCLRMLRSLRHEGIEPVGLSWALVREVRTLAGMAEALAAGQNLATVMANNGVWEKRKGLVAGALKRHSPSAWASLMRLAVRLDRTVKGAAPGDPWGEIRWLCVGLAGQRFAGIERTLVS